MKSIKEPTANNEQHWEKLLHRLGIRVENSVDFVRDKFRRRMGVGQALKIIAFHGMGNDTECRLQGRVLEYSHQPSDEPDSLWKNLQDSYRRFETDEVPGITVRIGTAGTHYQVTTDEEGYFTCEFPCPPNIDRSAYSVALSLPEYPGQYDETRGRIFFPAPDAAFGVISDIDDTVLITQATSIVKMMRLTLLESSKSRLPFDGVAAFYDALHDGRNPFFYVSSSPWNLFEFLDDFLRLNRIISAPLLLRDFGIDKTKLVAGPHGVHKLAQIRSVMHFYPDLPFILIGDSGQHDPEIYAQIVNEFPGRVEAVYVRDVTSAVRDQQVMGLAEELRSQSVDMLLVPDTLAAASHAVGQGYIAESTLASIAKEVEDARAAELFT